MTSYINLGGNLTFGGISDTLFSAVFTAVAGGMALRGLEKINVVFHRGSNALLTGLGWDTSKRDSWPQYIGSFFPKPIRDLLKPDVDYNRLVPVMDKDGKAVIDDKNNTKTQYEFSNRYLLFSGIALSVLAVTALEFKHAIWRETNPLLNVVLKQISPFQMHMGDNWIAQGINAGIGAIRSRIG